MTARSVAAPKNLPLVANLLSQCQVCSHRLLKAMMLNTKAVIQNPTPARPKTMAPTIVKAVITARTLQTWAMIKKNTAHAIWWTR